MADDTQKYREYATKLEAALGLGAQFGVEPVVHDDKSGKIYTDKSGKVHVVEPHKVYIGEPGGKKQFYIIYPFRPGHLSQPGPNEFYKEKTWVPAGVLTQAGKALEDALNATTAKTGLSSANFTYSLSEENGGLLMIRVDDIETEMAKSKAAGKDYFASLAAAKPELHTAVKAVVDGAQKEKKQRYEGYAKRLSAIMGTEVVVPEGWLYDKSQPEVTVGKEEHNYWLANDMRIVRESKAGLGPEDFGLYSQLNGKVALDVKTMEAYDARVGTPGAAFALLEKPDVVAAMKKAVADAKAAPPVITQEQRFAHTAKFLAHKMGIAKQFPEGLSVHISHEEMRFELSEKATKALPKEMRDEAMRQITSAAEKRLNTTRITNTVTEHKFYSEKMVSRIVFDVTTKNDTIGHLEQAFDSEKFGQPTVVELALLKAKEEQYAKYSRQLTDAFGSSSAGRGGSKASHIIEVNYAFEGTQDEQKKAMERVRLAFKQHFDFGPDIFTYKPQKGPTQLIDVNLTQIDAYDKKHGEGAFAAKYQEVKEKFRVARDPRTQDEPVVPDGADPTKPPVAPVPPMGNDFMSMLSNNKGMGIGGIIGAIIGWIAGGPIGALIGVLLGGGGGAFADGKKGVFKLGGGTEAAAITPKLLKEVQGYAQVRFMDYEKGVVDQVAADAFVKRYSESVAPRMKPEEQDARADAIAGKTAQIWQEVQEAASKDKLEEVNAAMKKAMESMRGADAAQIQMKVDELPNAGLPLKTMQGVKDAAKIRR